MAMPLNPAQAEHVGELIKRFVEEQEAEVLRLLSLWVSELEPAFVYSYTMALRGITVAGWDTIVIHATNDPGPEVPSLFHNMPLMPPRGNSVFDEHDGYAKIESRKTCNHFAVPNGERG